MNPPPVILLHGLRHTYLSMRPIQRALDRAGRVTYNIHYPSGRKPLEALAEQVLHALCGRFGSSQTCFDFAGHSMGAILVRIIARKHPGLVRRAVLLGPPNRGSELVNQFIGNAFARWIMGPAGMRLGVAPDSVPNTLGPANFDAGIIAGNRPDNPFSRFYIPGEEDGRVSVERTCLEGMADHMVVPHGHFFIMRKPMVVAQTVYFLEHGCFAPEL